MSLFNFFFFTADATIRMWMYRLRHHRTVLSILYQPVLNLNRMTVLQKLKGQYLADLRDMSKLLQHRVHQALSSMWWPIDSLFSHLMHVQFQITITFKCPFAAQVMCTFEWSSRTHWSWSTFRRWLVGAILLRGQYHFIHKST